MSDDYYREPAWITTAWLPIETAICCSSSCLIRLLFIGNHLKPGQSIRSANVGVVIAMDSLHADEKRVQINNLIRTAYPDCQHAVAADDFRGTVVAGEKDRTTLLQLFSP
jgi:hypothetical protein